VHRPTLRDLAALLGALALVALALLGPLLIWRSNDPNSTATQVQGYFTSLGVALVLVAWLYAWWRRGRNATPTGPETSVEDGVTLLAAQTLARWEGEAHASGITVPAPVRVAWAVDGDRSVLPDDAVPATELDAGVVSDLYSRVYGGTGDSQVVLVGAGGAGKTGAMILLLLEVLRRRRPEDGVPVWLTLSGWNPATTTLVEYARLSLEADYPVMRSRSSEGRSLALGLLEGRRVALFLDGLDELPPAAQASALDAIDIAAVGARVVLTSRPSGYAEARKHGRLSHPVVVALKDVDHVEATRYLRAGHDDPRVRRRFKRIAGAITARADGPVGAVLNNPLYLSLARVTYAHPGSPGPGRLLRLRTRHEVRAELLHTFVRNSYPGASGRVALLWLGWIAANMAGQEIRWWRIPEYAPRRRLLRSVTVRAALTAFLAFSLLDAAARPPYTLGLLLGTLLRDGLTAALVYGGGTWWLGRRLRVFGGPLPGLPRVVVPRRFTRADLAVAGRFGTVAAALALLIVGLADLLLLGLDVGEQALSPPYLLPLMVDDVPIALAVGAVAAVVSVWMTPVPESAVMTPPLSHDTDRRSTVIITRSLGLLIVVAFALPSFLQSNVDSWEALAAITLSAALYGVPYAICLAQFAGLVVGSSRLLGITERLLRHDPRGRVRFVPLLEDAWEKHVLRQTGIVYQFRHSEVKDFFGARYGPEPGETASMPSRPHGRAVSRQRIEAKRRHAMIRAAQRVATGARNPAAS
jgi:hypothetical protein